MYLQIWFLLIIDLNWKPKITILSIKSKDKQEENEKQKKDKYKQKMSNKTNKWTKSPNNQFFLLCDNSDGQIKNG